MSSVRRDERELRQAGFRPRSEGYEEWCARGPPSANLEKAAADRPRLTEDIHLNPKKCVKLSLF